MARFWIVTDYLNRESPEPYPTQQISEAGIIVQAIQGRFNFKLDKIRMAFIVSLFEPGEGLFIVSQRGMNLGDAVWRHVMLGRLISQLVKNLPGLNARSCDCIGSGQSG